MSGARLAGVMVAAGIGWLAGGATPALATVEFKAPAGIEAGPAPRAVASGDFDLDGNDDLAVADLIEGVVRIRLADGEEGFGPESLVPVGPGPAAIAVADLDGDGDDDLAVANSFAGTVSVMRSDGAGAFEVSELNAGGFAPQQLAAGQVRGGPAVDLLVSTAGPARALVLEGDGAGGFRPPVALPVTLGSPAGIAAGDLSGDGIVDVAVADSAAHAIYVVPGRAAGGYGAAVRYSTGGLDPNQLVVGRLDAGAALDVAVANGGPGSDSVGVRLGRSDGTLGPVSAYPSGGSNPMALLSRDLDLDGHLDLAVANLNSGNVAVLGGNGGGALAAPLPFETGAAPISLAAGDFDGDRVQDVAVANLGAQSVTVLINAAPDVVPPELFLPSPLTVDATGPAGARVEYDATATDNRDSSPAVSCSPPSGAVFAAGTTTVACVATDAAGNTTRGEFTVTVRGAAEQLQDLVGALQELGLPAGTGGSLAVKLEATVRALDRDSGSACGQLNAFSASVSAQSPRRISAEDAGALLEAASQIEAVLAC